MRIEHLERHPPQPLRLSNCAVQHKTNTEAGSHIRRAHLRRHVQHRRRRQDIHILQIPKARYQSIRKAETHTLVIRDISQQTEWQDSKSWAFFATRNAPAARIRCRTLFGDGTLEFCVDHAHWTHEAIAFPNHGLKEAWFYRAVAQRCSDFSNDIIETGFGVDKQVRTPKLRHNVLAGNKLLSSR